MNYDKIKRAVRQSEASDWRTFDRHGIWTLLTEPDITIRAVQSDREDSWDEAWAKKFPDSKAFKAEFELWFRNSPIEEFIMVEVDGGRHIIPLPERESMTITQWQYDVAYIVNDDMRRSALDDALTSAGITVK